ncbi:3D domain-containing protein [Ectobacillus antri]|uniref:3D domain-containing protein n=1 Tax=Ectobacillus antri TaxID=2486280 RepID=A0ABT6H7K6_9BACI|nr:3D domain-containing protein [Ectobacillus antri]MDG4657418.1 3D domain-containing protein [Ectobacillus antri]MDG5754451.1 3D domain-containing protein [Ectobacillus antri]
MKLITQITGSICALILVMISPGLHAQANGALNQVEQQLRQNDALIQQKEQERAKLNEEIQALQASLEEVNASINQTKKQMEVNQANIDATQQLIQEKREAIIVLENKVLARQEVMKKRIVSMQNNDNSSLLIEILINSENLATLLEKMKAVATILDADKDIMRMQQEDKAQIEADKRIIDQKEQMLIKEHEKLAKNQAELEANIQVKQSMLQTVQAKYAEIGNEIAMAEQDKQVLEANIRSIQEAMARQQEEAKRNAEQIQQMKPPGPAPAGEVLYMESTAYSVEKSLQLGEGITAAGYNLKANPNIKLIAVDPRVIPLGTRVWVEDYGEAVAGDTGGKIKGNIIDVLFPTEAEAMKWGRKKAIKIILRN